ncbi:outer membrane protein with glycine zipper [Ancylobacter aquaticus]|uniref:Outer membrane protein with glycine zipper n=1 Tax=Ancylobacter aquaticus TaxID=100 RepID=A0A4R1IBW4_ANCAQ|nr:glycine zipper domain-containing protein [Ancylobacter aquaticus]TCK31645.1 outer membrane protein with glycine zipper [Ancylobacter aquaticus]
MRWMIAATVAGLTLWATPPVSAQNSTARGAIIGGVAGAAIGGAATGTAGGAAAGAAIGAGTGAVIGSNRNRRARAYYFQRGGRCYLRQNNGRVVRVDRRRCWR